MARHGGHGRHVFELPRSRHHPPMKVRDPVLRIVTAMLTACFGRSVLRLAFVSAVAVRRQATAAGVARPAAPPLVAIAVAVAVDPETSVPPRNVMRPPGWKAIASLTVAAGIATRSAGAPGSTSDGARPTARRAREVTAAMASSGRKCAAMTIRAAVSSGSPRPHRVERILQVVGAGGDVDARSPQRRDRGQPTRHGDLAVASLQEEIRVRERDDADTGGGDRFGDTALHGRRLHAQAHAMAGRDRMGKARRDHPHGQVFEREGGRIERLVRVQIEWQSGRRGDRQQRRVRLDRIGVEMGTAADEVDPGGDGVAEQRPGVRTRPAGDRPRRERHDLQVDEVADALADQQQGFDRAQPVVHRDVGVAADDGHAVGRHQSSRSLGPFRDVVDGDQVTVALHGEDRAHQIAGRVLDPLGQERLVEVSVGLDERRHEQVSGEIDLRLAHLRVERRRDGIDDREADPHIGDRTVGERR